MSLLILPIQAQTDPLPSWNEGAAKRAIADFVARVTRQGGPDFVPPAERIATFGNDGTLWVEEAHLRIRIARLRSGAVCLSMSVLLSLHAGRSRYDKLEPPTPLLKRTRTFGWHVTTKARWAGRSMRVKMA